MKVERLIKYLTKGAGSLIRTIRAYSANPADHAREIVVLAAIVIVLLLLTFSLYLYVSAWRRTRSLPKIEHVRRPFNWKLLGICIVVTVGIIIIFGAAAPTSPSFCQGCHRMAPAYKSWRASSHKK